MVSSRPVPRVGDNPVSLFLSETGEDVLIAWSSDDLSRLVYRDSKDDSGWNNPLELPLSESLTLEQANQVLERRIRER